MQLPDVDAKLLIEVLTQQRDAAMTAAAFYQAKLMAAEAEIKAMKK
jgi:hypothetical protein